MQNFYLDDRQNAVENKDMSGRQLAHAVEPGKDDAKANEKPAESVAQKA